MATQVGDPGDSRGASRPKVVEPKSSKNLKEPVGAEARAIARHLRMTPRKLRLIVDLVRGKQVKEALQILRFVPKHGAKVVEKVIQSALANAENEPYKMDADNVYISAATVDQGPVLKRWIPRAQGRASAIRKRMSHVTIRLRERETAIKKATGTVNVEEKKPVSGRRPSKAGQPKGTGGLKPRTSAPKNIGKKKEAK